jgi:hypothetical protein
MRRTIARYIEARSAVLAPKTLESLIDDLAPLAGFLSDQFP